MKYTNEGEARRADEKNGVIFPVIMFTPRVIVTKISKMAHFLYFLQIAAKKDLIEFFQK